jgi:hypothetical protein
MESNEKTFPQVKQSEACLPEQPIGAAKCDAANCQEEVQHNPHIRKDKNRLHATRHGVLSRYPLEALASLGENTRNLRRIERKFREELKPSGIVGATLFDRLFSSYLRCLLAARAEAALFAPIDQPAGESRHFVSLKELEVPTLVLQDSNGASETQLPAELLRQLALAARYDAHFPKKCTVR